MAGLSVKAFTVKLKKALESSKDPEVVFREHLEAVQKLEKLDDIRDLKFISHSSKPHPIKEGEFCFDALYSARAAYGFYPHVRQKLVKRKIFGIHNFSNANVFCKSTLEEYEELKLNFYGNRVQIILQIRPPEDYWLQVRDVTK